MILALLIALAQPAPVAAPAPNPATLAAARATIDVVMPPERRAAMVDTMLAPMLANVRQATLTSPSIKTVFENDPKKLAVLERFLDRQHAQTVARLRTALPAMIEAMTKAYARRFTAAELADVRAFFATPSGRAYLDKGASIMGDPDVQAWQREMMVGSMEAIQTDTRNFIQELLATEPKQ